MIFGKKISSHDIFERHPGVEWKHIEDSIILMDKKEGELIRLNEVGAQIWVEMDGHKPVETIIHELIQYFDAPEKKIRKEAMKFIDRLSQMELITRPKAIDGNQKD